MSLEFCIMLVWRHWAQPDIQKRSGPEWFSVTHRPHSGTNSYSLLRLGIDAQPFSPIAAHRLLSLACRSRQCGL